MVTLSIKRSLNKACFLDIAEEHGSPCNNTLFSNNLIILHSLVLVCRTPNEIGIYPTHFTDNKQNIFFNKHSQAVLSQVIPYTVNDRIIANCHKLLCFNNQNFAKSIFLFLKVVYKCMQTLVCLP